MKYKVIVTKADNNKYIFRIREYINDIDNVFITEQVYYLNDYDSLQTVLNGRK